MKLIASQTSPYARKVRIALAEKKIECDLVEESPWTPDTSVPNYNPLGKVPVLVLDDGFQHRRLARDHTGQRPWSRKPSGRPAVQSVYQRGSVDCQVRG